MRLKIIKSILSTSLGISSIGVVTPIVVSSCGEQSISVDSVQLNKTN